MSKTLTAAMTAHLAERSHSRCRMVRMVTNTGTVLGFTDHDKDIDYDLLGEETLTYRADAGLWTSDIQTACSLDAGNCEIRLPLGDIITLDGVLGGVYNRARVWAFEVNWKDLGANEIPLIGGRVGEWRVEGGNATAEIRDDRDGYNQQVLRIITNQCDADFGDARCGATVTEVVGTVTASSDPLHMTVSFTGTYADNFFNKGTVTGLTGANSGVVMEIHSWTAAGVIVLFAPLVETPAVGDTFTLKNGCSKIRMSDDPTVPTCLSNNNVVNFRGFPEVPGSDQVLRMPIPGQGNSDD